VSLDKDSILLHAALQAGVLDRAKGPAALLVYNQLRQMGGKMSFGEFLVERKLLSRIALEGLERNLQSHGAAPPTISTLGDFELLRLLGEGNTGSVFRARHVITGRAAAIKVLSPKLADDPQALQRFKSEAQRYYQLQHPNIIRFLRLARTQGLWYIVMELAEGGSARGLLRHSGGQLSEGRAMELTKQTAQALSAAHAIGLLHRDVKPENILLDVNGNAKLSDFGIAERHVAGGPKGEFWGTPAYLAPEVISGQAPNDPRSDLYSLGCVLHEFLAGSPPFSASTPEEVLRRHLKDRAPDIRTLRLDVSPAVVDLLLRLLQKDPALRFPDAASVAEYIGANCQTRPISTTSLPAVAFPPRPAPQMPPPSKPGALPPLVVLTGPLPAAGAGEFDRGRSWLLDETEGRRAAAPAPVQVPRPPSGSGIYVPAPVGPAPVGPAPTPVPGPRPPPPASLASPRPRAPSGPQPRPLAAKRQRFRYRRR
jgi:serine/threonine-protein kinase